VGWLIYAPIIGFTVALVLISYFYFINVRHIQEKNDILANKINNVYWILAEDNKFWYDKNSQKLFIENYNWIKDYKQNLQKKNKK
ncbi:hypothetical protein, partial [uncultured Cetobacterium sp.]|uniref:hypothetical protein n=1 Tax=uncultured Cetobacterium sp. TaxID=527638 RepID=UPI0026089DEC